MLAMAWIGSRPRFDNDLFLLCAAAGYVSGQKFPINGVTTLVLHSVNRLAIILKSNAVGSASGKTLVFQTLSAVYPHSYEGPFHAEYPDSFF
jgi:hypothetical protein